MSADSGIVLASRSPRRRRLLEQIGVPFSVQAADVDESRLQGEPLEDLVRRLARRKAAAVRERLDEERPVLGADTIVALDGAPLGKPADRREAIATLGRLSGREHQVLTAVALLAADTEVVLSRTRVWFREIAEEECAAYVATGEPMDKAGSYAIQGRAAVFVRRLDGSYSGVMGLPLFETAALLERAGLGCWRAPK